MLNQLAKQIHENNKSKGFYEGEKNIGEMLALIHSEVSEALEADRKNQHAKQQSARWLLTIVNDRDFKEEFQLQVKDSFEDELADVVIRVMDLAAFKGIDLESHIKAKVRYNQLRPHKHGKRY